MADTIITVDKFLGLNESADGSTELKPGEAAALENFLITDEYNLRTRPGIIRWPIPEDAGIHTITKVFPIVEYMGERWLCCQCLNAYDHTCIAFLQGEHCLTFPIHGHMLSLVSADGQFMVVWENDSRVDNPDTGIPANWDIVCTSFDLKNGEAVHSEPYIPLAVTQSSPSGGGVTVEPLNILTDKFRVVFAADGTAKYVLPPTASAILECRVDGIPIPSEDLSAFDMSTNTFTFSTGPDSGSEVEFLCMAWDNDLAQARLRLLSMPHCEYFNGATDTRIFFYGDGSNIAYYTGVPAHGTGLYIPAGNELAVNFSDSPITGLIRHYSRLLAFKPDGVEAITYEPVTLADGSVIAGFFLRPVSRAFGNDAPAQLCLVGNSPRSFTGNSIYEWRVSSNSYRDERYAKCISQKVARTLAAADLRKVVAVDDDATKTYYVFLNDAAGTVLVHRYELDTWSLYRSQLTTHVAQALAWQGKLLFLSGGELFTFDQEALYDAPASADETERIPIKAHYESGYQAFGADHLRKYSGKLWISLLPQSASSLDITVKTDKRSEYLTKTVGYNLFDWSSLDFSNFSFQSWSDPKIKRVSLKVKKFVYYKLIFDVTKPGARATVLGYDQQLRYASPSK